MPDSRKVPFINGELYHVFNRGIDRRPTFTFKRECDYMLNILRYYQFSDVRLRYSNFRTLPPIVQSEQLFSYYKTSNKRITILAFSLMPNHFHLLVQQNQDNGISDFISKITNSYTKYFNPLHKRVGPLFQGLFKSVHVESDEQLIHVARYIHLNPVVASIIPIEKLASYPYTSYVEYLNLPIFPISNPRQVLGMFKDVNQFVKFTEDHTQYAKTLHKIQHLAFNEK